MSRPLLLACILLPLLTACIPKAQYDTVVTQRDYYQNQTLRADSLAQARALDRSDSLGRTASLERRQLKEIEDLTATNQSLSERLLDARNRYETLVRQNSELLSASGSDVISLQQNLLDRGAELSKREAEVQRMERNLLAREQRLGSLPYPSGPQGTNPVDPQTNAAVDLGRLYDELGQLMLAVADSGYVLREPEAGTLKLVMNEQLLFTDGQSVSLSGQQLLRKLSATLRNYPRASYLVIGHAESVDGNALLAYDSSLRRAVNVALQLSQFGLDAGRIVAGGMGFYGRAEETPAAQGGLLGTRRTELVIGMEE